MATTATPRPSSSPPRPRARAYDAFVSYSHAADGRLAPALQAGLQSLAKPWYRRRALRVFRDKTSLSASPELWSAIEEALSQSRFFVLLASPAAAVSHWVDEEVRWWRANRGHDTVLIVLTDGELGWDEASGDFDAAAAIPPGLRGWFPREPLWVDLRWARDERDVSMRNPRFRDSVGELAAPMHGVPKDELIGADISQHRRTLRLARGAVALLVLLLALAVVGGIVALVQRDNARNQTELAVAGQVSATAVANLGDRLDVAQLLAAEGYTRRETSQTTAALFRAATESPYLAEVVDSETRVTALVPAPDGDGVIVGGTNGTVRTWSVSRDQVGPPLVDLGQPISALQASENGRYLAAGDEAGSVSVVDLRDHSVSRESVRGRVDAVAVADDGRWLAVASDVSELTLYDLQTEVVQATVHADGPVQALAYRDGGRSLFIGAYNGSVQRRSLPTLALGGAATAPRTPPSFDAGAYSANRRYFGFYNDAGVPVWDIEAELRSLPTVPAAAGPPEADRQFPITSTGGVTALAISPDASRVAVATEGAISVVEPELRGHGPYLLGAQPGGPVTAPMTGISGQTNFLAFLGSGQRLVSSSGSLLVLWDPDQEPRIARPLPVTLPDLSEAGDTPGLSIARGGDLVAWTSTKPEVGIWEPETGRRTLPIPESPEGFVHYNAVALSRSATQLVAAGNDGVQIWDLVSFRGPVSVPSSSTVGNDVVMLEPDTSTDSMFAVWDNGRIDRLSLGAARLQPLAEPSESDSMDDVEVVPEAGLALEVLDGRLSQIDLATGRRSAGPRLGLPTVSATAVTRDGHLLAAADGEESAVLWDLRRGEPVQRLAVGRVAKLALNPDGRLMATVTGEGLMSVWDTESGTKLGEVQLREGEDALSSDRGYETALGFSSDGDLWTATAGGRLIRWQMSPDAWAGSICATVNRSLTQGEWDRYIGTGGSAEFACPDS